MDIDKLANTLAAEHVGHHMVRTAGEIRHIKDTGPQKRRHVKDHAYSPKDLKQLTKVLWQISVALGHLSSATGSFTRIKSVRISPDGVLGGTGYDRPVRELRMDLYKAIEALSAIQDTLYDEVNAPHWKPQVEELPPKDKEDVEEMIEEVDEIREDPATYGDEAYEKEVEDDDEITDTFEDEFNESAAGMDDDEEGE